MSEFDERHQRLWHSGHDSSELDIVANPARLRAQAVAWSVEEARKRREAAAVARRERLEAQRYARYINTVGRSFEAPHLTVAAVQRVVAKHYDISRAELLSQSRTAKVVRPRQVAMYLAKVCTGKSWAELGQRFANRDHTTVMHAFNRVSLDMAADPDLAAAVAALRRALEGQRL